MATDSSTATDEIVSRNGSEALIFDSQSGWFLRRLPAEVKAGAPVTNAQVQRWLVQNGYAES